MTTATLILIGSACALTGVVVGVGIGLCMFALCRAASDGR